MREAEIENLAAHDIYAGNNLFGEAMLLRLALPDSWELAPGVSRPEVSATHERRNQAWVVSGRAWYVIYQTEKRWALELALYLHPARPQAGGGRQSGGQSSELTAIAGHPAQVGWKTRRRGLPWNRHDVTFLTVRYTCPLSERRIELELSGWCPRPGFEEVLQALQHLRCH